MNASEIAFVVNTDKVEHFCIYNSIFTVFYFRDNYMHWWCFWVQSVPWQDQMFRKHVKGLIKFVKIGTNFNMAALINTE